MAIISLKEVKNAIKIMMEILEKLDAIYHALHDKEDGSNGKTYKDDQQ
jgi:xylose isomerase